jgi:tetratricopeptide (TPR) repeat protein
MFRQIADTYRFRHTQNPESASTYQFSFGMNRLFAISYLDAKPEGEATWSTNELGNARIGDLEKRACSAYDGARFTEATSLFKALVSSSREHRSPAYGAWALRGLGESATFTAHHDLAIAALEEAGELCRAGNDRIGMAHCLHHLGQNAERRRRLEDSRRLLAEAREIFEQARDTAGAAGTLCTQAEVATALGQHESAAALLLEARRLYVELEDRAGETKALYLLSSVEVALGRLPSAEQDPEESRTLANSIGSPLLLGPIWYRVGMYCARFGDVDPAEAALVEAMSAFQTTGQRQGQALCHEELATVASPILSLWVRAG